MGYLGKSIPRFDAVSKVTGEALYPGDFNFPNQVYLKILFSPISHGIIKKIDLVEAEIIPGVLAILTAKDVPVNEYGLINRDQPVLCGPDPRYPFANRVRFIGDQIAVVVAESDEIASQARDKILLEYEELPLVLDPQEAIKDDSVMVHPEKGTNIFSHFQIRHGDIEIGFNEADVIVEGEYQTPVQEHAYLQPEAGVSYLDENGRITVVVAGQWIHEDQEQIAHALDLPLDQIRVIYPAIGGAFGGREDMSVQIVLALTTYRLSQLGINRPVKTVWSRQESIIGHHKRHAYLIRSKWGAKRDGKLTAVKNEIIADGGAYIYTSNKVLANATLMSSGPYEIPNAWVDSTAVYTNHIPGGAFRGFGGPQAAFAAEMQMNKLAAALQMDPVELRMRNLLKDGSILPVGSTIPGGVSIVKVVEACALRAGWIMTQHGWVYQKRNEGEERLPGLKRGIGFACGYKNVGFSFGAPEKCHATIELYGTDKINKVILRHAGADVGQGAHSAFLQIAADALEVPIEIIELDISDTATSLDSGSASASRMTFMAGNSIIGASREALSKWRDEERPAIATYRYVPPKTTPMDPVTGSSDPNFSYGYVAEAVELEVDLETGKVNILKIICSDDVGKAINPQQVEGQIEGAIVQAAGYSLLENFLQKDGAVLTDQLSTYLIPTILDIPAKIESIIIETPDPNGPYGGRGMAEMPFIPLAPAIGAALHEATGKWFDKFPYTSESVFQGIYRRGTQE